MTQSSWPFEYSIRGITSRDEILRADGDVSDESDESDDGKLANGCERNDVFLVEGTQLRYGAKAAWDLATR